MSFVRCITYLWSEHQAIRPILSSISGTLCISNCTCSIVSQSRVLLRGKFMYWNYGKYIYFSMGRLVGTDLLLFHRWKFQVFSIDFHNPTLALLSLHIIISHFIILSHYFFGSAYFLFHTHHIYS